MILCKPCTRTHCEIFISEYSGNTEAAARRCSVEKVFLKISQNSPENTCARVSFLIKLQARPVTLLKKRLWYRCFPVNFAKFLGAPFFIEHLWRLPPEILI